MNRSWISASITSSSGAGVRSLPIGPEEEVMKVLREAVEQSSSKPKAVVLNYPNNPTAKVVDLDFYEQVVDFCLHHGIYILSDIAYAEIYFEDPPPSILQIKRAWDIAVEFSSMSKTYSMPGWRIGFATGNKKLIGALARIAPYRNHAVGRSRKPPDRDLPHQLIAFGPEIDKIPSHD